MEEFFISTLSSYPNKKIVQDLGLVFVYDDRLKPMVFVEDSLEYSQKKLQKKAQRLGANAVLGVQFQYDQTMRMMLIGSAVVLENSEGGR